MSSKRRFIVISDIHFNDGNAGRITDELNKCFFPYVKKNKEGLSALIIAGDLFDTKIGFNSIAAFLVINFIMRLVEILGDIPLIIIKGTRTHDFNQLETFNFINDVTIVNTYEGFDIDDAKVLFLPEEYVSNADKYYNFDDMAEKFDLIVMHGMIDFAAYTSNTMESEKEVPSAVTFKSDRLNNLATVTIAGHVHMPLDYKNLHYCSSFSRSCFGEDGDKGFIDVEIDIKKKTYSLKRIKNKYAPVYLNVKLSEIYSDEISEVIDSIQQIQQEVQEVRLEVDMDLTEKVEADIALIREHFGSSFKIKLTRIRRKKPEEDIPPEVVKILREKVDIKQTITSLIKQSHPEVNLTSEEVGKIISKEG